MIVVKLICSVVLSIASNTSWETPGPPSVEEFSGAWVVDNSDTEIFSVFFDVDENHIVGVFDNLPMQNVAANTVRILPTFAFTTENSGSVHYHTMELNWIAGPDGRILWLQGTSYSPADSQLVVWGSEERLIDQVEEQSPTIQLDQLSEETE